jgi:hypothetical protein
MASDGSSRLRGARDCVCCYRRRRRRRRCCRRCRRRRAKRVVGGVRGWRGGGVVVRPWAGHSGLGVWAHALVSSYTTAAQSIVVVVVVVRSKSTSDDVRFGQRQDRSRSVDGVNVSWQAGSQPYAVSLGQVGGGGSWGAVGGGGCCCSGPELDPATRAQKHKSRAVPARWMHGHQKGQRLSGSRWAD